MKTGWLQDQSLKRVGPWQSRQQLELVALCRAYWFNAGRLFKTIGHVPPDMKIQDIEGELRQHLLDHDQQMILGNVTYPPPAACLPPNGATSRVTWARL